jgi:hypothetical protein
MTVLTHTETITLAICLWLHVYYYRADGELVVKVAGGHELLRGLLVYTLY